MPTRRITPLFAVILGVLFFACVANSTFAQSNVRYRPFYPDLPPETTGVYVNDMILVVDEQSIPVHALVVGWQSRIDRTGRQAFIYDHFGLIDPDSTYADSDPNSPLYDPDTDNAPIAQKFWDIQELVGPNPPSWAPATHTESSFVGINQHGRLCGYVNSDAIENIAIYFDLNNQHQELQPIPSTPAMADRFIGRRVNDFGDILVASRSQISDSAYVISVHNPDTSETIELPELAHGLSNMDFNSSRQVVANSWDASGVFRHAVVDNNGDGVSDGASELLSDLELVENSGINESSQFSCVLTVTIPVNSRRVRYEHYAARIGATGAVEWNTGAYTYNQAGDINNSGDMLHRSNTGTGASIPNMFYEGDPQTIGDEQAFLVIDELMVAGELPYTEYEKLTDRDFTGFGWMAGRVDFDGDYYMDALVIAIPELPGPLETYSSADTPLAIPDFNPQGISSTISVPDDVTITGLTVTLDISHSRPTDLQVVLTGPNGTQVPLTNYSGDNLVPDFTGTSSQGDWTLQVVDTRNRREGTLNGWSIAVDY